VDAPEIYPVVQEGGLHARLCLVQLALGRLCRVRATRAWPDPYGRMIAHVRVEGVDLGYRMLQLHAVRPWPGVRGAAGLAAGVPKV